MLLSKLKHSKFFLILMGVVLSLTLILGKSPLLNAQPDQGQIDNSNQPSVPVLVASRFEIKPEKREVFLDVATKALESSRSEPGNISYGFYEDPNVRNSFIYFEEWKSREALAQHLKQPYAKAVVDNFPDFVKGTVDFKVYDIKSLTTKL